MIAIEIFLVFLGLTLAGLLGYLGRKAWNDMTAPLLREVPLVKAEYYRPLEPAWAYPIPVRVADAA